MKNYSTELTQTEQSGGFKGFIDKIGKRNVIIAVAVLLIGAAVWLNFILFTGADQGGYGDYDKPSGNISDNLGNDANQNDGNANTPTGNEDTYFSATLVSRQKAVYAQAVRVYVSPSQTMLYSCPSDKANGATLNVCL